MNYETYLSLFYKNSYNDYKKKKNLKLFYHKTTISLCLRLIFEQERVVMRRIVMIICLMVGFSLAGQETDGVLEIMRLLGAGSIEEVSDDDVEGLSAFLARPLKLNLSSVAEMVESGLLDRYRAMSFDDYRRNHGYVLSLAELAMVDGFGEDFARRLSPFIRLDVEPFSGIRPSDGARLSVDASIRTGVKIQDWASDRAGMKNKDGTLWKAGVKAAVKYGENIQVNMALNSPYGRFQPEALNYTAGALWRSPKLRTRFLLGDFNARFGQGLALRNGLSLGSLSSPSAFMKNPTGLSLSSSFTGTYAFTGLASETSLGRYVVSGFIALPRLKSFRGKFLDLQIMPAVNIARYGRSGHVAMTHYSDFSVSGYESAFRVSSVDTRWCVRGVDLFAETSYDWSSGKVAALAGAIVPIGEWGRSAAMVRCYPSDFSSKHSGAMYSVSSPTDEYGASLSAEMSFLKQHKVVMTLDGAYIPSPKKDDRGMSSQVKCLLMWEWQPGGWFGMKARFTERLRTWGNPSRTDMRLDLVSEVGDFRINMRFNALANSAWGLLSYVEGGYVVGNMSLWLRQGFFMIDDWDDRIYVYERSAPGAFNVPAYYGRGLWTALTASARFSRLCKLYLRAACTAYPFMAVEKRKPGKAELEFQYVMSF